MHVAVDLWDRRLERLQRRRAEVTSEEQGFERLQSLVAAALNTGAIEGLHGAGRGLTLTVVEHAVDWEPHVVAAEGSDAAAHVAAAMEAFDMVLDVATGRSELSEKWIRELHATVTSHQSTYSAVVPTIDGMERTERPLNRGSYKKLPNHVQLGDGNYHAYCPVDLVPAEMGRLIDEIRSEVFAAAHPIVQSAFVHHAFVAVHPFQDGNGRVARLLASLFLLQAASIPLLVYADEQVAYFDALARADDGDLQPFVTFVQDRAVDLMAQAADLVGMPADGTPLRIDRPIDRLGVAGVEAAERLADFIEHELQGYASTIETSAGVSTWIGTMGYSIGAPDADGRRTVRDSFPYLRLRAESHGLSADVWIATFVTERQVEFPVVAREMGRESDADPAEFRLADLYPSMTVAAEHRARAYVRRVLADAVRNFQQRLDQT